jgi:hypothetical protein
MCIAGSLAIACAPQLVFAGMAARCMLAGCNLGAVGVAELYSVWGPATGLQAGCTSDWC